MRRLEKGNCFFVSDDRSSSSSGELETADDRNKAYVVEVDDEVCHDSHDIVDRRRHDGCSFRADYSPRILFL